MTPLMLISALVTSYMCIAEGQSRCNGQCVLYDMCPELYAIISKPSRTQQEVDRLRQAHCGHQGSTPKLCCPSHPSNPCYTPHGQSGECVSLHSCQHLAALLQVKPVDQAVINFVQNSRCSGPDQYSVCCSSQPPVFTPSPPSGGSSLPLTPRVCQLTAQPPAPGSMCCGRDGSQDNKIVGGTKTKVDQYPWLTLIEYVSVSEGKIKLLCGGSLISGRYVLTAAHCIVGAVLSIGRPTNVRLGEYDTTNDGPDCIMVEGDGLDCTEGIVVIGIEETIGHPQYNPASNSRRNDIALVRMNKLAPYNDFIRPICLPSIDTTINPPSNWKLYAAGWGAIDQRTSKSSVKLFVDLPYRTLQQCQAAYSTPPRNVQLWKGQICAGGVPEKDTCKGDSGGPLMYENPEKVYEIVGIVSFGPRVCGSDGVPGVYTKVFEYRDWIRSQIRP